MIKDKRIGNAQTIGRREVQSNFFSTAYNSDGDLFSVLADGTVDHPNGRRAAILAVMFCVREFPKKPDYIGADQFFYETALKANQFVQDNIYNDISPHLSLTMALFSGRTLHYFNVGSNHILIYDGKNERQPEENRRVNNQVDCMCGEIKIPRGVTAGLLSCGAFTSLHPIERIRILKAKMKVFDKAQTIIQAVNAKNLDNQLNASVVLVEGMR